jgi:hypothetical protein
MAKTAVDWLIDKLEEMGDVAYLIPNKLINQAKAIEKEQMLQFGSRVTDRWGLTKVEEHYIEDEYNKYYKETHGTE